MNKYNEICITGMPICPIMMLIYISCNAKASRAMR